MSAAQLFPPLVWKLSEGSEALEALALLVFCFHFQLLNLCMRIRTQDLEEEL